MTSDEDFDNGLRSVVLIIFASCVLVPFFVIATMPSKEDYRAVMDEGARAQRAGLNGEANPYVHKEFRKAWLDGWIESKEQGK